MNIFQSINESTTNAVESGNDYINHTEAYFKLKIFQQLSLTVSMLVKLALIGGLISLGSIFFAIAGALALGKLLSNLPLGMLITGTLLLICAMVAYFLKKSINKIVLKKLSKTFFD